MRSRSSISASRSCRSPRSSRSSARSPSPALLWALMTFTDLGKAIRAVAREREGARLVGIRVEHIYAMTFGIGTAMVAAAACLLLPTFYVTPQVGYAFVLVAFTTVVLGGMGSFVGALVRRPAARRHRGPVRSLSRRKPRTDRHLRHLHPGPAVPSDRTVRGARMSTKIAGMRAACGAARACRSSCGRSSGCRSGCWS